jgi:pimeloyl-ACP methyl ester carboxylesterase/DNA-binding CsgD family transcriptional regulator
MPSAAAFAPNNRFGHGAEVRFARLASGTRIAWAASGRGPPLVRVAHWMTHVEQDLQSPFWRPWITRLSHSVQLVRYDERGCGLSGADSAELGLGAALEELEVVIDAVCEATGHKQVALLGMSGAGAAAIAYAAKYPERVTHLVLHGAYACGLLHRSPTPEQLQMFEATVKLMELGWGRADAAVQQFMTTSFIPDSSSEQALAFTEQQRLSCDGQRAAAIFRARVGLDVRGLLAQVRCPTLVLHCDGDAMVPIELGRALAAHIEGARFETLPSRNHIPLAGEPAFERFCDAVREFVAPQPKLAVAGATGAFTPREKQLMSLVASGLDNLQIAAHLGLTDKTVRNSLSRLYAKLGVEGRPMAVVRTRELGFG